MDSALFIPIPLLLAAYAVMTGLAGAARRREARERAERFEGIGFVLLLLTAAYTAIMLIAWAAQYPQRVYDMLIILIVVGVFFALLLFLFLALAESLPRVFRRGGGR